MDETHQAHTCPYCGGPLHWVANGWFGRGTFDCERCGDFPDMGTGTPVPRPAAALAATGARRLRRGDRPRVLLVDDSPEYRDLYAAMLADVATVITAARGEDALAIAGAERIDAIVLDVMMPGLDGWQTCERLKSAPETQQIPVIMLTSFDGRDVPETASRVGAVSVVIKPCSIERLTLAIQAALH